MLSSPVEASWRPSGLNATPHTKLVWPRSGSPMGWPVARSQSRTVLSWLAEASRRPSGLNATLNTEPVWLGNTACSRGLWRTEASRMLRASAVSRSRSAATARRAATSMRSSRLLRACAANCPETAMLRCSSAKVEAVSAVALAAMAATLALSAALQRRIAFTASRTAIAPITPSAQASRRSRAAAARCS